MARPSEGLTERLYFQTTVEQKRAIKEQAEQFGDQSKVIRKAVALFLAAQVSKPNQSEQQSEEVAA